MMDILKFSSVMSVSMTSLTRRFWSPCSCVWRSELGFKAVNAMLWSPHRPHQCLRTSCTATDLSLNLNKVDDHTEGGGQSKTSVKVRKRLSKKVPVSLKKEKEELTINWLFSLSAGDSSSSAMTEGGLPPEVADRSLELCDGDGLSQLPPTPTPTYSDNAWVLGIDPDIAGAVAVLKPEHPGSPAQVYDAPNVKVFIGKRVRRRLDARSIVSLLRDLGAPSGSLAYIEQSRPFPNDGKQGWWCGGFGYGLWIGTLVASGFSVIPIPSMVWKKHFDLCGGNSQKDESRAIACSLFASLSPQLKRKKDHGRAEALLIAAYGRSLMKMTERDSKAG